MIGTLLVIAAAALGASAPVALGASSSNPFRAGVVLVGFRPGVSAAQRCYSFWWNDMTCSAIPGATGPEYTVGWRDLASRLRAAATASNSAGSSAAPLP